MLRLIRAFVLCVYRGITQLRKEIRATMAAIDDLKAAIGAVADDVTRIGDDVKAVLAKLASSNDPAVQAAADMLKTVDKDLDAAADAMEAAVAPTPAPLPPTAGRP
jgi:predicted trehalose synthase